MPAGRGEARVQAGEGDDHGQQHPDKIPMRSPQGTQADGAEQDGRRIPQQALAGADQKKRDPTPQRGAADGLLEVGCHRQRSAELRPVQPRPDRRCDQDGSDVAADKRQPSRAPAPFAAHHTLPLREGGGVSRRRHQRCPDPGDQERLMPHQDPRRRKRPPGDCRSHARLLPGSVHVPDRQ